MIGAEQEQELLARLDSWDPEREDLPDEIALAMDESEALRTRFDQRFARFEPEPVAVPDQLAERVLAPTSGATGEATEEVPVPSREVTQEIPSPEGARPGRSWGWVLPLAALAAAVPLVVGVGMMSLVAGSAVTMRSEPAMVGPAASPIPSSPRSPRPPPLASERPNARMRLRSARAVAPTADPSAEDTLRQLGYVDDDPVPDRAAPAAPGELTGGDRFDDHGVNTWLVTRQQPVSTFSIDVDRGSYSYGRRMLRSGFLPDPSSVRVEEYVNALRYEYPDPEDGPFAVQFEASPSPWNDARYVVRIGVQARRPAERPPVHLTFLVDTSGSMSSHDRLPLVQQALRMLAEQLGDGDTLAIVSYAGSAGVVLEPTPATRRGDVLDAINRLSAGGSTAMGQGIELAFRQAESMRRDGHVNRVVIASDGDANVGVTDTAALSKLIAGYADRGITLTTLGFGTGNYQDARMEQLADDGDGNYYYIDGEDEARRVFVDELAGTMEVVARDVKLQVDWNREAVQRYRLIGYENRRLENRDFRDDRVDAGEIGAGHTVTALYAVELVPGKASPLATVRVRSKPPGPEAPSTERRFSFPRGALQPSFDVSTRDHRMAVAAAAFAERLRGSPFMTGIGFDEIGRIAEGAARPGEPLDQELVSLVQRAQDLAGEGGGEIVVMLSRGEERHNEIEVMCGDRPHLREWLLGRTTVVAGVPDGVLCQFLLKGGPPVRGFVTAGSTVTCGPAGGETRCAVQQAPTARCDGPEVTNDDGVACGWP